MTIPSQFVYPIYTLALGLLALAVIPRSEIRRLSFFGIVYGAIPDFFLIIFISHLLGAGGYKNYYPFGFMGIPFFPLAAWVFYFIIYLYFLPNKKPRMYIYTVAATGYSTIFSNVLQNLGIFQWNIDKLFLPFLLYLTWNFTVTLTYLKFFQDKDYY